MSGIPNPNLGQMYLRDEQEKLGRSAIALRKHIFGATRQLDEPGFIGIGYREIFVYMHCTKRQWRGERPSEWDGYSVRWRWNVGPAIAQFDHKIA